MQQPLTEPVAFFLTIMAIILLAPLLSQRLRIPGIVGLILGGMLVGPHALGLLATERVIELLSTVGLIYLMFSAGLEIDLTQFARVQNRSIAFGLLTFGLPVASGTLLGRLLGLSWMSSVLLGSVYASHTLVAFPILSRLGIVGNEAVAVTIGATVFTDVASLLVLAIVVAMYSGAASLASIIRLIALMLGYAALVLWGLPRVGKAFFRRFTAGDVEFQFVLVALFLAGLLAEQIGMHAIVGAFLAGLAINATLPPRSRVVGQVLFLGQSFFIPVFLLYVGMVLDPRAIFADRTTLLTGLALTLAVYATKYAAAWLAARRFGYSRQERLTMWGLSQAQAAATLATILVALEVGLFPLSVFNGALLMILATAITSPILVQRFGSQLEPAEEPEQATALCERIIIAVANPETEEHLVALAGILARTTGGTLMPLHVILEVHGRVQGRRDQQRVLSCDIVQEPGVSVTPIARVDSSVAKGIVRASIEYNATMVVMGWRGKPTFQQTIFGTVLDEVIWSAPIPVLVGRMVTPINALKRIVLVIPPTRASPALIPRALEVASTFAASINVPLLILVSPRQMPLVQEQVRASQNKLSLEVALIEGDVVRDVASIAHVEDMIVVTSSGSAGRFRSSLGQIPQQLVARTESNVLIVHFP
jgi:Kef-type K+ transport system membrane component KefB